MPGRENSKSQGVVMTSASGRGGSDFGGEIETLGLRAIILAFYARTSSFPSRPCHASSTGNTLLLRAKPAPSRARVMHC